MTIHLHCLIRFTTNHGHDSVPIWLACALAGSYSKQIAKFAWVEWVKLIFDEKLHKNACNEVAYSIILIFFFRQRWLLDGFRLVFACSGSSMACTMSNWEHWVQLLIVHWATPHGPWVWHGSLLPVRLATGDLWTKFSQRQSSTHSHVLLTVHIWCIRSPFALFRSTRTPHCIWAAIQW